MKFTTFTKYLLLVAALSFITNTNTISAEQLNCMYPNGKFRNDCDHNCRTDPKARFNSQNKCSVCGHRGKKHLDFFLDVGKPTETKITKHTTHSQHKHTKK